MAPAADPETTDTKGEKGSSGKGSSSERQSQSGGLSDWTDALREMAPYLDLG